MLSNPPPEPGFTALHQSAAASTFNAAATAIMRTGSQINPFSRARLSKLRQSIADPNGLPMMHSPSSASLPHQQSSPPPMSAHPMHSPSQSDTCYEDDSSYDIQQTVQTIGTIRSIKSTKSSWNRASLPPSWNADGTPASPNADDIDVQGGSVLDEEEFGDPALRSPTSADDERLIRTLSDYEGGFSLLLERAKESMVSCKEAVLFLKKRAQIEEEYAKSMMKLAQSFSQVRPEAKAGSFGASWTSVCQMHEKIGEYRLKLSEQVSDVADNLSNIHKNTERSRKQLKEAGAKSWKLVQDSEAALEKTKTRYEQASEEWEKAILSRDMAATGEYTTASQSEPQNLGTLGRRTLAKVRSAQLPHVDWNMFKHGAPSPQKLQKLEDDARAKAFTANENYKAQLQKTNCVRTDYFHIHLPRYLRMLKETNDECDQGIQTQLNRFAQQMETAMMSEATTISPLDQATPGILGIINLINNRDDFDGFVKSYLQNSKQHQKGDLAYQQYTMAIPVPTNGPQNFVFGVDLAEQLERDNLTVPLVVSKCIEVIERNNGMRTVGLYRVSGQTSVVQQIRASFNKNAEATNVEQLMGGEVNNVTSALKLFFRELPDPLIPRANYHQFVQAAQHRDPNARLVAIHELINSLSDYSYATLQALMLHLWKVQSHEFETKMNAQNLSIIWGPTLLDAPKTEMISMATMPGSVGAEEIKHQSMVIETILSNFEHIFEV
ncbi:hypothetical protein BJ742DRAFT_714935 [Cladochytrium replicatum]|nr:hypothetical protein BJ742DRAFT_714935 [Cladochytrium replicatum]